MKTGFEVVENNQNDVVYDDFIKKSVVILTLLSEDAIGTAQRFCEACGRNIIAAEDMKYALMYEAHEFFNREDMETRFSTEMNLEDDSGEEEDSQETEDEETQTEEEEYSIQCVQDTEFYNQVLEYVVTWKDWNPNDPVVLLIKNAIDNIPIDEETV